MSNFAANANYNHASSDGQQGNPPAHTVGSEFSRQFYFVLTQQPSLAHRFYTDGSSLTHSTGETGVTVYGQAAINEKIMSLSLDGASAEVANVDAQYSLAGGITVLVTGHLTTPGKERKAFVQSFFLATQERGYFVLNDTFRYLSEPAKAFSADFAAPEIVANGSPQQYGAHHEANGYSSLGSRPASAGLPGQAQHPQAPPVPQPQASAFQQGNGHFHSPQANPDLGSGFSSGHSSGDLAQIPSPPPSQGLPPPPPKPSALSVAPTPTPAQQTPTGPSQEPSAEQVPEQQESSQQQQPAEEKSPSRSDQLVPQPPVDQHRSPVKPQRRPSAPAPQEADKKSSSQQSASAASPTPPRSYADLLRSQDASAPSGSSTQASARIQAPSQSTTAAPEQPSSPSAPAPAPPPRPSGNRSQGRNAQAGALAGSASSDTSGRGEQAGGSFPKSDKPGIRPVGSEGPPARPPYNAPGGRGVQYNRDDDSSKKAVYVRNIPQDATSDDIRELFSQYGTVRSGNGAITLKHNGGNNSFAYVDFMDIASAQACVDAKDVMLKDNILLITPKRANYGGGRGGGRFGGRGDGRGAGGYGRGRGGDRGGFQGRGASGSGSGSFPDDTQLTGGDRPQGGRPQNGGGQGAPRGRGGRDGGRGRGRGGPRPTGTSQAPEVAPPAAE